MAQNPPPTTTAAQRRERNALGAQPWQPIPSGQLTGKASRFSEIRRLTFETAAHNVDTYCSLTAFSALSRFAQQGAPLLWMHHGETESPLRPDSMARLNSYLRTATLETMALPWHHFNALTFDRYTWAAFCEHLALDFSPEPKPDAFGPGEALDSVALDMMTPEQIDHVSRGIENCFGCLITGTAGAGFFLCFENHSLMRVPAGITAGDVFTLAKILSA